MKLEFEQEMYPTQNRTINFENSEELKTLEAEYCCSNPPIYEITYNHILRKWLVCNECVELEFFNTNIKEKVRIQK